MSSHPHRAFFFASLCILACASLAFAQTSTATLKGVVDDGKGGVAPGAAVTLTQNSTGLKKTFTADDVVSGDAIASFLLGNPATGRLGIVPDPAVQNLYYVMLHRVTQALSLALICGCLAQAVVASQLVDGTLESKLVPSPVEYAVLLPTDTKRRKSLCRYCSFCMAAAATRAS